MSLIQLFESLKSKDWRLPEEKELSLRLQHRNSAWVSSHAGIYTEWDRDKDRDLSLSLSLSIYIYIYV